MAVSPRNSSRSSFNDVLTLAVADITTYGFDSPQRIEFWTNELSRAAERSIASPMRQEEMLRRGLETIYRRLIDRGQIAKRHPGVARFVLERVRPHLRAELDRRIFASADLIRLNRSKSIDETLQRFKGWATSVPVGGSKATDKREVKADVKKALGSLSFEERRVVIDQGYKLASSISDVLAREGGALAGTWRSHYRQAGYNYREDHKERDGVVYVVRGNWALARGLMSAPNGYTDEIDAPGEKVFCRCYFTYIYSLRDLPATMLTKKGVEELARIRKQIRGDSDASRHLTIRDLTLGMEDLGLGE